MCSGYVICFVSELPQLISQCGPQFPSCRVLSPCHPLLRVPLLRYTRVRLLRAERFAAVLDALAALTKWAMLERRTFMQRIVGAATAIAVNFRVAGLPTLREDLHLARVLGDVDTKESGESDGDDNVGEGDNRLVVRRAPQLQDTRQEAMSLGDLGANVSPDAWVTSALHLAEACEGMFHVPFVVLFKGSVATARERKHCR